MKCVPTSTARVSEETAVGVVLPNNVVVTIGRGSVVNDQVCVPRVAPSTDTTPASVTVCSVRAAMVPLGVKVRVRPSADVLLVPAIVPV